MMNFVKAVLAESPELPPVAAMVEYIVAGNGLFVRAEDSRLAALVPITKARLSGLADVEPYARLKIPRVPAEWLWSVLNSARAYLPNEAMYQFIYDPAFPNWNGWRCGTPPQVAGVVSVTFADHGNAVIDLHSHNSMGAFFSTTDDEDEGGLRFYVVIGRLDTPRPEIAVRMGVYGHHWEVPATEVFEGLGPFVDTFGEVIDVTPEIEIKAEL